MPSKTRDFPISFLLAMLGGDNETSTVYDRVTGNGRWSIYHEVVFEYENKYYQVNYSVGATEQQDEGPWEYQRSPITCTQVEPKVVPVTKYMPVEED